MSEVLNPALIDRARLAVLLFEKDEHLVNGQTDVKNSLTAPAQYGTYSIRLPYPDQLIAADLSRIKAIEWICMDRRVANPFHQYLTSSDLFNFDPSEVLVVSYGGGGIQEGEGRIAATKGMFEFLQALIPNPERIFVGAHSKTCGAVKAFLGGSTLSEAIDPKVAERLETKYIFSDGELNATIELLAGANKLLPPTYQKAAIPLIA